MGDAGQVFVTVGTTSFDALIEAVDSAECKAALAGKGYSSLVIQLGRGSYIPSKFSEGAANLNVEYFRFAPDLQRYMSSAALVISHAGSGSIFETLRMGKPLVVVVNEALMDNHQAELAEELAASNYLFFTSPRNLVETIQNMDLSTLITYEPCNPSALGKALNHFLGFDDD